MTGKLPPQATDLEEAVLGALMIDSSGCDQVADILTSEMFYTEANQAIYRAIMGLYSSGQPVDLITVVNELRRQGTLQNAGGMAGITKMTDRVVSSANIEFHARIITQKFVQREMIRTCCEAIDACYDETSDIFDVISASDRSRDNMLDKVSTRKERSNRELANEVMNEILSSDGSTNGVTGVPAGFIELDKITGGWQATDLIIIAARPAMGKTAFVLQSALNACMRFDKKGAVFSLEMSDKQLMSRQLSIVGQVEIEKILKRNLSGTEIGQLKAAKSRLEQLSLFIDDTPAISTTEFRAKARKLKRKYDIDFIVVDYLQLMRSGDSKGNREQEIGNISRALKAVAKELEIPVIALSQLSRNVESRTNKRPMLSDLRESGSIEQDADMVCFLYRPEYYDIEENEDGKSTAGLAEFIIAKHRNGATNDVELRFVGKFTSFVDMDVDYRTVDDTPFRTTRMNDLDHVLTPNVNFYENDKGDETPF